MICDYRIKLQAQTIIVSQLENNDITVTEFPIYKK